MCSCFISIRGLAHKRLCLHIDRLHRHKRHFLVNLRVWFEFKCLWLFLDAHIDDLGLGSGDPGAAGFGSKGFSLHMGSGSGHEHGFNFRPDEATQGLVLT